MSRLALCEKAHQIRNCLSTNPHESVMRTVSCCLTEPQILKAQSVVMTLTFIYRTSDNRIRGEKKEIGFRQSLQLQFLEKEQKD